MTETLGEKIRRIGDDAYDNRNDPLPEGTKVTRGNDRTKTLQVRLNDTEKAMLDAAAADRGIPTSTLARHLLLRGLSAEGPASDVELAEMLAASLRRKTIQV